MDAGGGLTLSIARRGDRAVISARGELDYALCPRLAEAIDAAAREGVRVCLVDCGLVTFIDSEAIKVFYKAKCDLAADGRSFALVNCSSSVAKVLRILQLDEELCQSEDD